MNTTENATNPPMPPRLIEEWTAEPTGPSAIDGWAAGPFAICDALDVHGAAAVRAWLELRDDDKRALGWLYLGRHPKTADAISACRDVAGALQRARRHG